MGDTHTKLIAKNKKAYFDYEVLEKFVTGIVLNGSEVKSIKEGRVQLKGSYAQVQRGRVVVEKMHISPYRYSAQKNYDPNRPRVLLLRKKEVAHLAGAGEEKGYTLIPLEIFLKNRLIKVLLGVCRGKKAYDKRATLKKRAVEMDVRRAISDRRSE